MNGHWVVALILIVGPIVALILIVRGFLRSPPTPLEFRKQFVNAWLAAGLLALGAVWLIHMLIIGLNNAQVILVLGVGGFAIAALLVGGLPISWVAMYYYRQHRPQNDFADDATGNSVPDRDISKD